MINRYLKYKKVKLLWFENIPNHWNLISLKNLLEKVYGGGTPNTAIQEFWAEDHDSNSIPWVAISDITKSNGTLTATSKRITEAGRKDKGLEILPKGTLLMSIFASLGKTTILKIDATINQAILGLVPSKKLNLDFLEYLLVDAERYVSYFSSASTQENLNLTKIRNLQFPVPSIEEQTKIAQYLDYQTSIIDELIHQKEKLIELLKEKRQSVINEAVTKGLNPNIKLKDSGIDWLGEIPEEWDLVPLKHLGKIKYGLGQPPKYKEGGLPLIRATNVERGKIVTKDLVFVDPDDVPFERDPVLRENDIIVVRSGAYTADSAIIPKEYEGAITGYDMVIRAEKVNPKLLAFCLLSYYLLNNQLFLKRMRSAQPHLNAEELGESILLLPPQKQQTEIVFYLENQLGRIEELRKRILLVISKLKEYRQSIISEAVTGKIDVRDWQPKKQAVA